MKLNIEKGKLHIETGRIARAVAFAAIGIFAILHCGSDAFIPLFIMAFLDFAVEMINFAEGV